MRVLSALFILILSACGTLTIPAFQSEARGPSRCGFEPWMKYRGVTLHHSESSQVYGFVTHHKAVDGDGAPNAYHPDDVGNECRSSGKGLDCPTNAGYPDTSWWSSVLVPNPVQPAVAYIQPSGPFAGFFVSQTALQDSTADVTNPGRYVDASRFPYLVFPRGFYRMQGTGKLGDIGFAYNKKTGNHSAFLVGDVGPANARLGEASIALHESLGGAPVNPRTGAGLRSDEIVYLVFPYSVGQRESAWPLTLEVLNIQASELLERHGGFDFLFDCVTRSP